MTDSAFEPDINTTDASPEVADDQRLIIFILTYENDLNTTVFFDPENQIAFQELTELVNKRIAEDDIDSINHMPDANDNKMWELVNEMADQLQSTDNNTVHLENPDMPITVIHIYDPLY